MKLSPKVRALHDLVAPAVAACGVLLWGVEFTQQGKHSLLRIFIDALDNGLDPANPEMGKGGVGAEDCARVSHQVSGILDVHDPIAGEYVLEVSSPGWDRPFFSIEQMLPYQGKVVQLRVISPINNQRKFTGTLVRVDALAAQIEVDAQPQSVVIERDNIDKINLVYQESSV